ncbi:MAG: hypothetical protein WBA77_15155 [Microcoleaceae cyanobacterium]
MRLQGVIVERVILSGLITLVVAIATHHNASSIHGFSFLSHITPLAELEGIELDRDLYQTDYTLSQSPVINTRININ